MSVRPRPELRVWFKISGGLGTYTAKHHPLAVYVPSVQKTFFVYGGTTYREERHLLAMVSYYDHRQKHVPMPTVVHDKQDVDDPHDNPSINLDDEGHIWIFVSGRGQRRPGFKYRSAKPFDIEDFELVSEEEFTYPQPWWVAGSGFLHLFTRYTNGRELYWNISSADELSESNLYLTNQAGDNVWRLPYRMQTDYAPPVPLNSD